MHGHGAPCCAGCSVGIGHIEGAGPDVSQGAHARSQLPATLLRNTVGETTSRRGARMARQDLPPLHDFAQRRRIVTQTQLESANAGDAGVLSLPGRWPTTGWDGEPGAQSPTAHRGGF